LLSFKDIRSNGYHTKITNESNVEYIYITSVISCQKHILEKLPALSSGLYHTTIRTIDSHVVMKQKFSNPKNFILWHDRLGHPSAIMILRIIENLYGHTLKNQKVLLPGEYSCKGKLIIKPSSSKITNKISNFLERIQGDICGPIHPPSGPFSYFMVLIDAFT